MLCKKINNKAHTKIISYCSTAVFYSMFQNMGQVINECLRLTEFNN